MIHVGDKLSDSAAGTIEVDSIRDWLYAFAAHVRACDFAAASEMFADDVVSFGSWTGRMDGLEALVARQWNNVWPKTADFQFDLDNAVGDSTWTAATWTSVALHADGTAHFTRRGRATFVFRREGIRLLAIHSHFSLDPAARL